MTLRNAFDGLSTEPKQDIANATLEAIRVLLAEQNTAFTVTVSNLPGSYPLPTGQVSVLTPQKDALTDAQLRATPLPVTVTGNETLTNGTQRTRLLNSDGTAVDSAHPLPISGRFTDENGAPYSATNPLPVDVGGSITIDNLTVAFDSVLSTLNSTQTPLGANATFTGTWEDVTSYAAIIVAYYTDQASAPFGAVLEFSIDGSTALPPPVSQYSSVPANTPAYVSFPPGARYMRVRYTNGPVAQTFLQSQVILAFQPSGTTQAALAAPGLDSTVANVVKSVLAARFPDGSYSNLQATAAGALSVNDPNSDYRYAGGKTAFAGQVTTSGDNTLITPAAGKRLRVFWAYALSDPNGNTSPLLTIRLGSSPIYCGYALSHWEVFTGAVDAPLVLNLDQPGAVAVTIHYQEVT